MQSKLVDMIQSLKSSVTKPFRLALLMYLCTKYVKVVLIFLDAKVKRNST